MSEELENFPETFLGLRSLPHFTVDWHLTNSMGALLAFH